MSRWRKYSLLIALCLFSGIDLPGQIKNGYEREIKGMHESLKRLTSLLEEDPNLSLFQKATMKGNVNKLIENISYYELTEELLDQFKNIAPEIYSEMNSLKDHSGVEVTLFIKFVSEMEMQHGAAGTTNLSHTENDNNTYTSEYGPRSVSIKIASVTKSLILLAHEFGHAKYQVTHLASYIDYYNVNYQNNNFKSTYIGHNPSDPSGQSALHYEHQFQGQYLNFFKAQGIKVENPFARLYEIRKRLSRM
jgi:hypothetical protein